MEVMGGTSTLVLPLLNNTPVVLFSSEIFDTKSMMIMKINFFLSIIDQVLFT